MQPYFHAQTAAEVELTANIVDDDDDDDGDDDDDETNIDKESGAGNAVSTTQLFSEARRERAHSRSVFSPLIFLPISSTAII